MVNLERTPQTELSFMEKIRRYFIAQFTEKELNAASLELEKGLSSVRGESAELERVLKDPKTRDCHHTRRNLNGLYRRRQEDQEVHIG